MIENLFSYRCAKNSLKRDLFDKVIAKTKRCSFFYSYCILTNHRIVLVCTILLLLPFYGYNTLLDGTLTSISVLQRIRGVTIMRYINLHFTLLYFTLPSVQNQRILLQRFHSRHAFADDSQRIQISDKTLEFC